jgi:putative nucleotidyltransferase with HDIG domain
MSHLVDEARRVAQTHLEVSRPARWQHVTAVAAAAERLAALLDAPSSETVVTAAWLHDIGHAPGVRDTGFHALDGARFLSRMRRFPAEVIALVAHHSGADSEAAEHGLHRHLARFRRPEPSALALLSAADLCTGPSGAVMTPAERIGDILHFGARAKPLPDTKAHAA